MKFPEPPQPSFSEDGQLTNWIEIQTWGYHNNLHWNGAQAHSERFKLKEIDRLRITCAALLVEAERYKAIANKALMGNPKLFFP